MQLLGKNLAALKKKEGRRFTIDVAINLLVLSSNLIFSATNAFCHRNSALKGIHP